MSERIKFEESSGNVFADIGVADPQESLLRAELVSKIADIIQRKGLSQNEIAVVLGIDQPKVSKLMRKRISGFSSERLFRFLTLLGCDVQIVLKEKSAKQSRGRLAVAAA